MYFGQEVFLLMFSNEEIKKINNYFAKNEKYGSKFHRATVGKYIDSGGQAAVYFLNVKNSYERFVIKGIKTNDEAGFEKLKKASDELQNEDCLICGRVKDFIIPVERAFDLGAGNYRFCIVEKYHKCIANLNPPESSLGREEFCIEMALTIARDLIPLIDYAYNKKKIIHRDIKPENMFLKNDKITDGVMLSDFGIATHYDYTKNEVTTQNIGKGTKSTVAPEIIDRKNGRNITLEKADMYSLGMVIYYFLNDMHYPCESTEHRRYEDGNFNKKDKTAPLPKYGSKELKMLAVKTIELNPDDRFDTYGEMYTEFCATSDYIEKIENLKIYNLFDEVDKIMDQNKNIFHKEQVMKDFDDIHEIPVPNLKNKDEEPENKRFNILAHAIAGLYVVFLALLRITYKLLLPVFAIAIILMLIFSPDSIRDVVNSLLTMNISGICCQTISNIFTLL